MDRHRHETIGQANSLPGLTPAAVLLVLRHLKRDQAHLPQKADTIVATP